LLVGISTLLPVYQFYSEMFEIVLSLNVKDNTICPC